MPGEVVIALPRPFSVVGLSVKCLFSQISERKLANASWAASVIMVLVLRP